MTTMTRRQLYELIWAKPMRDAAAEIGLSDVGLKKVCLRHRVPVPPQGYWNKVHAGQKPDKIPFCEVNDRRLDRVEFADLRHELPPEVQKAVSEAAAREQAPEKKIDVPLAPPTLPAAVRLAHALKKSKLDEKGLAFAADPKLFHVRAALANIDRAVAIVEALLVAAADRGYVATPGSEHLTLVVDGEAATLSLKEGTRRQEEVDREERRAIRYRGADLPYRTFDKIRHVKQAAVVDNKRLGPLLAMIRQSQQLQKPERRSGPRRRDQTGHMFDVGAEDQIDQHGSRRGRRPGSALCGGSAPARRPTAGTRG